MTSRRSIALIGIIMAIIIGRLLPHAPNATPTTALIILTAFYLPSKKGALVALWGMLLSDLIIGIYSLPIMLAVYGSFALSYVLGRIARRTGNRLAPIAGAVGASILFFLVTNLAVWFFGTWYAHSWEGLMACYTMALPFFRSMLTADLIYTSMGVVLIETIRIAVQTLGTAPSRS